MSLYMKILDVEKKKDKGYNLYTRGILYGRTFHRKKRII